jgi:uncharacterized protein YjbI with pentapeptide repeats
MEQEELDKILEDHKRWLESGGSRGKKANFSQEYLDAKFCTTEGKVSRVIFLPNGYAASRGTLSNNGYPSSEAVVAHFEGLDFGKSILFKANFNNANFYKCNMDNVDFTGCDLRTARFAGVTFRESQFGGFIGPAAKLKGAMLNICDLSGRFFQNCDLSNISFASSILIKTDFRNANLSGCNLTRANLSEAWLTGTNLSNSNLKEADLTGAHLENADIKGCNLYQTNLKGCNLTEVEYKTKKCKIDETIKFLGIRSEGAYGNELFLRYIKDQAFLGEFKADHPLLFKLWWISSDCGRSLFRWACLSSLIALVFACFFSCWGKTHLNWIICPGI